MSPSIWTRCAARADGPLLRPVAARAWRVVEAQHILSTRKLVDSDEEQRLLEELIDGAKPALPPDDDLTPLHYLLSTPFRYPPLPFGSRFGTRFERGIWYGADQLATAFAEVAFYRLLFLEGTQAEIAPLMVEVSAFRVPLEARCAADLTQPPFDAFEAEISSPTSYGSSQQLGAELREAGAELARYRSARDEDGGACFAVFAPSAFAAVRPGAPQAWHCVATRERVELSKKDYFRVRSVAFERAQFLFDGVLPSPGTWPAGAGAAAAGHRGPGGESAVRTKGLAALARASR